MRILYLLFFFLFLNPLYKSFAGQIFYKEFNSLKGVPTNRIYDIASDASGIVYLGTDQGVYSYTGVNYEFIPFINAISNSITSISFTKDGTLWCRNFSDQVFYFEEDTLRPFQGLIDYLESDFIIDVQAVGRHVYLATYKSIYVIDNKTKTIVKSFKIDNVESINKYQDYLIVGNTLGEIFVIKDLKLLHHKDLEKGFYRFGCDEKIFFIEKRNGQGLVKELALNDQKVEVINQIPFDPHDDLMVNNINVFGEVITLSTTLGTYFYFDNQWKLINTGHNHSNIVKDFQGGYWISTIDGGLVHVPSLNTSLFLQNKKNEKYRHIIKSPRGFFISTNKGKVLEVSKTGEVLKTFDTKTGRDIEFIKYHEASNTLYTSFGHFANLDPYDYTYFYYGKKSFVDEWGNVFISIHSSGSVIYKDRENAITLPEIRVDLEYGQSMHVIRGKRTRTLAYQNRRLYISYIDKLILYTDDKEETVRDDNGEFIYAVDLLFDKKDNIWVATIQDGVYCFEEDRLLLKLNQDNGLSSNYIKRLYWYGDDLYIITINGVDKYNVKTQEIENLSSIYSIDNVGVRNVIKNNDFTYFITQNGIIKLKENNTYNETNIKLAIQNVLTGKGDFVKEGEELSSRNNTLIFNWELIDFLSNEQTYLYYQLKGIDDGKIKISRNINSIKYNNLPDGKYEFVIQLGDNQDTLQSFTFLIKKPYWKKWWFYALNLVVWVTIVSLTIRLTRHQLGKKQNLKEALMVSQLTALRAQMNPHFLYNVLNSLQGLIYSNKMNEAGTYISMFSEHLRKTLDISAKQWILIKDEIDSIRIYMDLEKLRFGEEFNYEIIKGDFVDEWTEIPSMIIQPFVENAVKHGLLHKKGDKKVDIHFRMNSENHLNIAIVDNGIGREKSYEINKQRKDKPQSFATAAIQDRIELLNKQFKKKIIEIQIIDLKDGDRAMGTEVNLTIDLKNIDYESFNS